MTKMMSKNSTAEQFTDSRRTVTRDRPGLPSVESKCALRRTAGVSGLAAAGVSTSSTFVTLM